MSGPSVTAVPSTATRALLGLHLVVLSIGVLQFAFAPNLVERPLLAAGALATSAIVLLLVRVVPALRRRAHAPHAIEIAAMTAMINLLALASGAAHSALLALDVVPLAALGIAFTRAGVVMIGTLVLAVLVLMLGAVTPQLDIRSTEFGMRLLSLLAPGAALGLILATLTESVQEATQRIRALAVSDALTGLMNLRTFEHVLQQEHRKAERFGRSYSILIVDVDNLARVNETFGHDAGNMMLNAVASAIARSVRGSDVVARLGGDEFVVLCLQASPDIGAAIAQRIRNNVYAGTVSIANRLLRANVSVGVASFPADGLSAKELLILAERRMQQDRERHGDSSDL